MRITNKLKLPKFLYDILANDEYDPGDTDYSVTSLIESPRIIQLKRRHENEIIEDVADRVWSMGGNALHDYMANRAPKDAISEERFFADVLGRKISGQIDVLVDNDLFDYKRTSVWSVIFKTQYTKWEEQLNCYAYLLGLQKIPVKRLAIIAVFRDWMESKVNTSNYPKANTQVIEFPLWSTVDQTGFIAKRIALHMKNERKSDDELTLCTPDEMWIRNVQFAIMKNKNKIATRLCPNMKQANATLNYYKDKNPKDKYRIEERPSVRTRCEKNICKVNKWCNQYQEYKGNGRTVG